MEKVHKMRQVSLLNVKKRELYWLELSTLKPSNRLDKLRSL